MISFTPIIQAGGGLIEELVRDSPPARGVCQLVGDWLSRINEYFQKDEAGPLTEFLFVLLCSVVASTLAFSHKRLSRRRSLHTEDCYVEFLWNDFECVPRVGEQYEYIMHVQFTPRVSGFYSFRMAIEHVPIAGSPFLKRFDPGEPTASHTTVSNFRPVMVTGDRTALQLKLRLRDRYGNEAFVDDVNAARLQKLLRLHIERHDGGKASSVKYSVWRDDVLLSSATLSVQLSSPGLFKLKLLYDGVPLAKSPCIEVVVLCDSRYHALMNYNEAVSSAELILCDSALLSDAKNTQFRYSIRVRPSAGGSGSEVHFLTKDDTERSHLITSSLKVSLRHRTVELHDEQSHLRVAVTSEHSSSFIYAGLLHLAGRLAGASRAFEERRDSLVERVRGQSGEVSSHQREIEGPARLIVCRTDPLRTTMKATECFDREDWRRKFQINIKFEIAADMGGLSREWFEILCIKLFDPNEGLFTSYGGAQGFVLPNASLPPCGSYLRKLEFAGSVVAKCVYESALGNQHRLTVKANFARSFLAQMLGRPVTYRHFKTDDPELYQGKIKYILENNVDNLQLSFIDEEFTIDGKLIQEVELISGGSSFAVTEKNKFQYLNALAEYRLARKVRSHIKSFMMGFNTVLNINFLREFDEEELELLLCGSPIYVVEDLRKNHYALGWTDTNRHILQWFWKVVDSFSEEELSQFVQFVTGSSRLPLGGFSQLEPWVHIVYVEANNILPSAHTCFNYLCLPGYDSCELLVRQLRTALREGCQGFGFV
ncbi:apoptosis-resistant E3 ubiquitin protein ligase 1-like isoform X2 [Varroa destructor]|uniref:HECT-type E3 ubiquitin transferase n=1 Tax=Varroa destructor TaxID=109461 RepID=A0A7M7KNZ7_VARDE|nr:apoptosis-resistant E3 ubiquitin protein ligase 1-like isoform X2 [Varroa destructor]